ncbi:unnamed protein product [Rotaria magnacalcarata]|uniref:Uncharacterized protein n=2 Tax=Rotaria magnacalcarata TaxID=392030 RepID=A0A815M2H5_9BILA|nr:unnamed protein product [Rotaria magnacalcarata]
MALGVHKAKVTRISRQILTQSRLSDQSINFGRTSVQRRKKRRSLLMKVRKIEPSTDQIQLNQQYNNHNKINSSSLTGEQTRQQPTYGEYTINCTNSIGNLNVMSGYEDKSAKTIKPREIDLSLSASYFSTSFSKSSAGLMQEDTKTRRNTRRRRAAFIMSPRCCCILAVAVFGAILLAALVAAVIMITKENNGPTGTSTTVTTTTATTTTTTTTSTTTTTTTSTTTTTTTSTATTCTSSCTNNTWNQTGVALADTSSNPVPSPRCIMLNGNDTVYVCGHQVGYVEKFAINGTNRMAATSNSADHLDYISFDKSGALYTTDHNTGTVQYYPAGSTVPTVLVGAPSSIASLTDPRATAVDSNYTLYINDRSNNKIMMLNQNGTSLTSVIDSNGVISKMSTILLKSSSSNELYISDEDGTAVYLWTVGAAAPSLNLTSVGCGNLNNPKGIRLDANGNLYVADSGNSRIVMFCTNSTVGTVILTLSSSPVDLDLDLNLNLYVMLSNGQAYKYQLI